VGIPLPEEAFCQAHGVVVHYLTSAPLRSATALLQAWSAQQAASGVRELNVDAAMQQMVPFNAAAQGYGDYGARVAIEGSHPDIVAALFKGQSVLDVGCGPGHFVAMLRERGMAAIGLDPYCTPVGRDCYRAVIGEIDSQYHDVVICREVLEHIPVREVGSFLHHLFRVARHYVYLTTRFTEAPAHPFALTTEFAADPSHITLLPQPFVRALCVTMGGVQKPLMEQALDWQDKGRVLVYEVKR
jgi:hypothetical protein